MRWALPGVDDLPAERLGRVGALQLEGLGCLSWLRDIGGLTESGVAEDAGRWHVFCQWLRGDVI